MSYQFFMLLNLVIAAIFAGAVLELYYLETHHGNPLGQIFLANLVLCAMLWLVIRRLRCPVCRNVFVGKESPQLLTHKCRHCGRRSGDTH